MDLLRLLRKGEYITYVIVPFLTALLLVLSLYLAFFRLAELYTAVSAHHDALAQAIYNALSDIFLVIVFIELIDTFITYIEQRRIVVYKIIDVALVALARELFIYLAPVNKEFQFDKAVAIVAATFVVGVVDYLQRKALRPETRRR
ncbi:MAG: phosphate-starvation-inducible PsiE family protein [Pyrobaculum sp.]|nr:phosphate-starvation-inducible PsiE family protein [Pyrobaculum sp.]